MYRQSEKAIKQQYLLHMSAQHGKLQPTNGRDPFTSLGQLMLMLLYDCLNTTVSGVKFWTVTGP